MEVNINKERMITRKQTSNLMFFLIGAICIFIPPIRVDFLDLPNWHVPLLIWVGMFILIMLYDWRYTQTLKYEIDGDRLISSYQIITKKKDIAKLYVVNNIRIWQGLIDKIFGLFRVDIYYGFGSGGCRFYFDCLSEQEANRVADAIKSKGRLVHIN